MILNGDYVSVARSSDGSRFAIPFNAPIGSGDYLIEGKTADGKRVAGKLLPLKASDQFGIEALTADGRRVGLTFKQEALFASIWKLDLSGSLVKKYDTGGNCYAVAAHGGQVYGGNFVVTYQLTGFKCFDESTGELLWTAGPGGTLTAFDSIFGLATDATGNVYAVGFFADSAEPGNSANIAKFTSDGEYVASKRLGSGYTTHADKASAISINGSTIWIATNTTYGIWGVSGIWGASCDLDLNTIDRLIGPGTPANNVSGTGVQALSDGGCYLSHQLAYSWNPSTVTNYFGTGYTANTGGSALSVKSNGSAVYVTTAGLNEKSLYKLPLTLGSPSWSVYTGGPAYECALDNSGNIYVCGSRNGGKSVWKYNASGSLVWSYDTGGTTNSIYCDDSNVFVGGERVASR